ncbi:MAG: hypothetical protein ACPG19_11225 [Saprospiraceae bacterium]
MKNLGMVFFLALAFTFVSNQAQAQAANPASCKKTCKKAQTANAKTPTCNKRNTAMLTLLGNEKTEKKATCQPAQCKTVCKKGAKTANAVKLVSNELPAKKASCKKMCKKNVKMTEKSKSKNTMKAVLAKNEE